YGISRPQKSDGVLLSTTCARAKMIAERSNLSVHPAPGVALHRIRHPHKSQASARWFRSETASLTQFKQFLSRIAAR
ncbi:MAG: hypothetical protein ABWX70_02480, partial [Hyphomicrobium sp.]